MDSTKFQLEEDHLLWTILSKRFFNIWQSPETNEELWRSIGLELFITSDCNLKCEYCYLNQHGDELYPKELRNEISILSNIDIIFNFLMKKNLKISQLDLFSGEIWHTEFGIKVLEKILNYIKLGVRIGVVMIPTNSCFILEGEEFIGRLQDIIDDFSRSGSHLIISSSIDGMPVDDISRPAKTDMLRDEKFYDRLFEFCKKNSYYFHPMVAASNVHAWIENYEWFRHMCEKHGIEFPRSVMMLEVRNASWTDENLDDLKAYYRHEIDYLLESCDGKIDRFTKEVLKMVSLGGENIGYCNISLPVATSQAACTVSLQLTIRVGDLMVVPCHRAAYDQFAYGKLRVFDGEIIGIQANNTQVANKILLSNSLASHHGCDICLYKEICMRGCYGEQFEANGEIFMPGPNLCKLMKSKYDFLIDTYAEIGVWEFLKSLPINDISYALAKKIIPVVDKIIKGRNIK